MLILLALVILIVACGLGVIAIAAILVHGTVTKSKMGINLDPSKCSRCQTSMPSVRVPKSFRQAMWGGWTCPNCGCEIDKWGREI